MSRSTSRISGAAALAALAALVWLSLGMDRGLLLSSDVKSKCWPWAPFMRARPLAAPALSDPVWQFVPWIQLARRELREGRLPLWNPHQYGGVPLLGNSISALGSPFVWPPLVLGVDQGWNLSLLLRVLVAAAGAFLWLRDRRRTPLAAALGAAAFALSGPFVAWLEHPQTATAAAIPLLLLFGGRLVERRRGADFAGLAIATYVVLAGGHPETWALAALLAGAYVVFRAPSIRKAAAPLASALLGASLAAPLLLPFFEYFAHSAAARGLDRHPFVLPFSSLVRFVLPRDPSSHPIEAAATVSLAALALVPFGLRRSRRHRETLFWLAVAGLALLLAYDNPMSRALVAGTRLYPSRALLLLPLALGFLAASGLDGLMARARLHGRLREAHLVAAGLVAAAAAELLLAARGVHAVTPRAERTLVTPLLARLLEDPGPSRVLPLHTFLPANSATSVGLDDLRGYDALGPKAFLTAREEVGRFGHAPAVVDVIEPWNLAPKGAALNAWNVKYLLLHPQFAFGAKTLNERLSLDLEEIYSGPDGRILLNRSALPRARLVPPVGSATVLLREPTRWRLATSSPSAARLVVANATFPGWTARVDGSAQPIASAEGTPLEVEIPAGRHVVELAYRPLTLRVGIALAALALVALVIIARRVRPS